MAISNFEHFLKNVTLTKDDGLMQIPRQAKLTSFCCGHSYDISFSGKSTRLCRVHSSSVLWPAAGGKTKPNLGSAVVVVFWKW
jgi:hypothetical protein